MLERMMSGDPGWILNTLENMNVMGSMSPIIPSIVHSSLNTFRSITENPDLLDTYQPGIVRNPVSIAGLSMLRGSVLKIGEGASNLWAGETTKGIHQLAAASPLPFKQSIKIALHQGLAETETGRTLTLGRAIPKYNSKEIETYNAAAILRDEGGPLEALTGAKEDPPAERDVGPEKVPTEPEAVIPDKAEASEEQVVKPVPQKEEALANAIDKQEGVSSEVADKLPE